MSLPDFHISGPFTLGIELEMQMINPPGYDLSQDSSRLTDAVKLQLSTGEVRHDVTEGILGVAAGVCQDTDYADTGLSAVQQIIMRIAAERHLVICDGGACPSRKRQRQKVCDDERYRHNLENFGYLIQQATVFGQHVHVSCANGGGVIYLLHNLSRLVPHFVALLVASPYMRASDTQLTCACLNASSGFPDNDPMPWMDSWQEFEGLFHRLTYTSVADGTKDLH